MSTSGSPCPTTLTKGDTSWIDIMVPDLTRSALSVVMGHQLPSDTTSGLGDDRTVVAASTAGWPSRLDERPWHPRQGDLMLDRSARHHRRPHGRLPSRPGGDARRGRP